MTENLGMCVATGPAPVPVNQRSTGAAAAPRPDKLQWRQDRKRIGHRTGSPSDARVTMSTGMLVSCLGS